MSTFFDHPFHREAEELITLAQRARRQGDIEKSIGYYAEAGSKELAVARTVDPRQVLDEQTVAYFCKMRTIFAISAVSCFLQARRHIEAIQAAQEFLALPELLVDGGQELQMLVAPILGNRSTQ